MNEFLKDAEKVYHNLKILDVYSKSSNRDPIKIYLEISTKNLIIGNKLCGPTLVSDQYFCCTIQKFFCTKVEL
jgi:hypothetical protein